MYQLRLHSSVGGATHWYHGGHWFIFPCTSSIKILLFPLKLENLNKQQIRSNLYLLTHCKDHSIHGCHVYILECIDLKLSVFFQSNQFSRQFT